LLLPSGPVFTPKTTSVPPNEQLASSCCNFVQSTERHQSTPTAVEYSTCLVPAANQGKRDEAVREATLAQPLNERDTVITTNNATIVVKDGCWNNLHWKASRALTTMSNHYDEFDSDNIDVSGWLKQLLAPGLRRKRTIKWMDHR
jgi:hypothetical protein